MNEQTTVRRRLLPALLLVAVCTPVIARGGRGGRGGSGGGGGRGGRGSGAGWVFLLVLGVGAVGYGLWNKYVSGPREAKERALRDAARQRYLLEHPYVPQYTKAVRKAVTRRRRTSRRY